MFRVTVDRRVINYRPSATARQLSHMQVWSTSSIVDEVLLTTQCRHAIAKVQSSGESSMQREVPFGAIHKTRPQNSGIFTLSALVHLCPLLPDSYPPLVDVHFIWLHFNTVTLSSDSRYTLTIIDMCLLLTQT